MMLSVLVEMCVFLRKVCFKLKKNKREIPKIMPDYPKNVAW